METTPKRGHSGRTCAVKLCFNNSKKLQIWRKLECKEHTPLCHEVCPCPRPYSLHRFPGRPEDVEIRRKWITNLNLKQLDPKPHSVVCGIHFADGKPTKEHPYPVLHLGYQPSTKLSPGRAPPKKRCRMQRLDSEPASEASSDDVEEEDMPLQQAYEVHRMTCEVGVQWPPVLDHTYGSTKTTTTTTTSTASQTDLPSISAHDLDDKDCKFFTGLSKTVFWSLISALVAFVPKPTKFKLGVHDQILLVLMRLRLGLMFTDLGKRFSVSRTTSCEIFSTWIPLMAEFMKSNCLLWLPRETLNRTRPKSFATNYPKATCIIDCTEIFVQRPQNLKQRAQTYSNYKHHNTYKALYCIAPNGFVMFVSKLFGGRASDVFISHNSGFTDQLLPGDEVLADRGFTIDDILPHGVKLAIPAFTRGLKQLPESAVTDTRRLANVRIHIERAIRRLKCFKILSNMIPGKVKNVDKILEVCAGLCNLQPLLIRDEEEQEMEVDEDTDQDADEEHELNSDIYMYDIAEDLE